MATLLTLRKLNGLQQLLISLKDLLFPSELDTTKAVTVTGSPTIAVTNGNQGSGTGRGPHTLVYASGTGSNELVFSLAIAADNAATNADDVLTIGAQNILKPGGATIKDAAGTASDSAVAISADQGTAAGGVTVTA